MEVFPEGTAAAIFFREGLANGYLYVDYLGSGSEGQAMLVAPAQGISEFFTGMPLLLARKRTTHLIGEGIPDLQIPPTPHEAIPRVFHGGRYGSYRYPPIGFDGHWCVQEYCNGGDLGKLIDMYSRAGRAIEETFIWAVLNSLSDTIKWLHHDNDPMIIHNDIAPRNIFLNYPPDNSTPTIHLGDFGLAHYSTPETNYLNRDLRNLGRLALQLVRLDARPRNPSFRDFNTAPWTPYSPTLRNLISWLLLKTPSQGPKTKWLSVHARIEGDHFRFQHRDLPRLPGAADYNVSWTRPARRTEPLWLSQFDLAELGAGTSEHTELLYGRPDSRGRLFQEANMLAPPWRLALVRKETREVLRPIQDEEVEGCARALGLMVHGRKLGGRYAGAAPYRV